MRRRQYDWQLPEEIELRLGDATYGRQRAIFEAGHLLVVTHAPPVPESTTREHVVFLRPPDGRLLCNGKPDGEPRLQQLLSAYRKIYEECDAALDAATGATALFDLLERLTPLNRASTNLYNALQSARALVREDQYLIAVRDEAYEISRCFELLLADAKLALDYRMARNAEAQAGKAGEMAQAQHKLNILAAVTFPLMALTAIFGMTLRHGLEGKGPWLFWSVFGCGFALGICTMAWVIRRRSAASKPAQKPSARGRGHPSRSRQRSR